MCVCVMLVDSVEYLRVGGQTIILELILSRYCCQDGGG
jgi:hypothetical protein